MKQFRRVPKVMNGPAYKVVADIINLIEDKEFKQRVADHFGTEFNRRSASFDPYQWGRITGGKVAPNSAFGGMPRS